MNVKTNPHTEKLVCRVNEEISATEIVKRIDEIIRKFHGECSTCRSNDCRGHTKLKGCRKIWWEINYYSPMGMWYFRLFYRKRKIWITSTDTDCLGTLLLDVLEKINKEEWVNLIKYNSGNEVSNKFV